MKAVSKKSEPLVTYKSHPAGYKKLRCQRCKQAMAVALPREPNRFKCEQCGAVFTATKL